MDTVLKTLKESSAMQPGLLRKPELNYKILILLITNQIIFNQTK